MNKNNLLIAALLTFGGLVVSGFVFVAFYPPLPRLIEAVHEGTEFAFGRHGPVPLKMIASLFGLILGIAGTGLSIYGLARDRARRFYWVGLITIGFVVILVAGALVKIASLPPGIYIYEPGRFLEGSYQQRPW